MPYVNFSSYDLVPDLARKRKLGEMRSCTEELNWSKREDGRGWNDASIGEDEDEPRMTRVEKLEKRLHIVRQFLLLKISATLSKICNATAYKRKKKKK